jgi:hypothetical protein
MDPVACQSPLVLEMPSSLTLFDSGMIDTLFVPTGILIWGIAASRAIDT